MSQTAKTCANQCCARDYYRESTHNHPLIHTPSDKKNIVANDEFRVNAALQRSHCKVPRLEKVFSVKPGIGIFLPRRLLNATSAHSLKNIEQVKEDPPQRGGPNDRDDGAKPEHKDCAARPIGRWRLFSL